MAWAFLPQPARRVRWRLLCLALALSVSDVNPANAHGSVGSKPRQDLGRHPPGSPLRPLNRNALGGASPKAGGDTRGGKLKITGTASSSEDEEEEEAPVAQKRTAAAGQVRGEKKRKGEAGAVPARKEPPHAKKDRPPSKQPPAKQTPGAAPVHGIFKSAITAPAAGASGTDKTRKAPAPAAAVSGTDKIRKAPAVAVAVSAADKVKKAAAGGAPFISSPTFVSSVPGYVFKKNKSNGLGYYKDVLPVVTRIVTPKKGSKPATPLSPRERVREGAVKKVEQKKQEQKKPDPWKQGPQGLKYRDISVGNGESPKRGQQVTVHYTGKLSKNGKQFDSSVGKSPLKFGYMRGEVIKGWDLGLEGMKCGGRRILEIPAALGYGRQGAGRDIPPHSDLTFEVELLRCGR